MTNKEHLEELFHLVEQARREFLIVYSSNVLNPQELSFNDNYVDILNEWQNAERDYDIFLKSISDKEWDMEFNEFFSANVRNH